MNADASFALRREAEAAKKLMAMLRSEGEADDVEIVETAIEGETSLLEAVAAVIADIDEDEAHIIGLKAKEAEFASRRAAKEHRNDMRRAAIEQAMIVAGQEKISLPTATVFISKRAPGLIVEDEADIPSEFFKAPEPVAPKLDKRALATALKDGRDIPGARLDNGSISLSVRRK